MSADDDDLGTNDLEPADLGTAEPPTDDLLVEEAEEHGFLDKLRGGGVGTEDPMIVGDVGPTDIPPGRDGEPLLVTTDEPVDHLEV